MNPGRPECGRKDTGPRHQQIFILNDRFDVVGVDSRQRHENHDLGVVFENINRRLPYRPKPDRRQWSKELTVKPLGAHEQRASFRPHPVGIISVHVATELLVPISGFPGPDHQDRLNVYRPIELPSGCPQRQARKLLMPALIRPADSLPSMTSCRKQQNRFWMGRVPCDVRTFSYFLPAQSTACPNHRSASRARASVETSRKASAPGISRPSLPPACRRTPRCRSPCG